MALWFYGSIHEWYKSEWNEAQNSEFKIWFLISEKVAESKLSPHYTLSYTPREHLGICKHFLGGCFIEDKEIRLKSVFLYLFIGFIPSIKHNPLLTLRYRALHCIHKAQKFCVFQIKNIFYLSTFLKRWQVKYILILNWSSIWMILHVKILG